MDFNLSKEQQLLRDGLAKFLSTRYDLEKSRAAAKTGIGWQPEIWRSFADELGILGATFGEEVGGIGGGPVELMVISEELGRALVVEPYVDSVVVCGGLLRRAGGERAMSLLEQVVAGDAIASLAAGEADLGDHWTTAGTTAERDGDQWILNGDKTMAMTAPLATHLLLTATTSAGLSLFLVDMTSAPDGLTMTGFRTVDDRRAADIVLTDVRLPADALLGVDGQAGPSLSQARDEGAAAVCSEAVGCMRKVLADTVEYCKQRQQFGVPIGSFQVLQHRMVDMHIEVEQASAAALLAVLHLEDDADVRARAVSAAKATVGRAARFVGQQSVQLHGGMGMTEELAIGHYFKRLTAVQYEFGSTDHHIGRYAELVRVTAQP